jgi:ATP-dependent DNA helicase DinG
MAEHYDRQIVLDTIALCEEFFAKVKKEFLITRDTVRLTVPNWIDDEFPRKLEALASLLEAFAMNAKTDKLAAEIRDYKRIIVGYKNTIEDCIFLGNNEDYVYWVERTGKENRGVAIRSAPLKIAPILRRELFSKNTSVIMTSATLAISNDMESFVSKVGAEDAETFICDSPFNYNANMRAFIATDAPDIEKESRRLDADYISRVCKKLCESIRGGTLILFTSFADLYKTADYLEEHLPTRKIIVQGRLSKSQAMREFSENGSAILLGTDTFWTGIDMPGEKLSQVIVARLPFENPSHPLAQARADRVLAEGGKPFQEITIPSAVIKFRQGIGRLIRSKTDKGIVVVLDSRIVSKAYGKNFVDAIPTSRTERFSEDEIDSLIADSIEELGLAPKKNRKLD